MGKKKYLTDKFDCVECNIVIKLKDWSDMYIDLDWLKDYIIVVKWKETKWDSVKQ